VSTDAVYNLKVSDLVFSDALNAFKLAVDSCILLTCAVIEAVKV
jgi:hypothetical protein